ncbi:MAG: F0F1 ATP synthase subunit epsilon [Bacillota bacterium]|nr:F0F1 ATP synthase subunit epsilon [Bacillota bacterium]
MTLTLGRTFRLEIVTPERTVFDDSVEMVIAPTYQGYMGVAHNHTPILTVLTSGVLRFRQEGEETRMAVSGGFMDVRMNRAVVLAEAAEFADEIDVSRAMSAYRRALARLLSRREGVDYRRAQAAMDRALARLKAVGISPRK